jgi:hypothetical protein
VSDGAPIVLKTDECGYIIAQASVARIQPRWATPLRAVVDAYRVHYDGRLHSVYVRGSVAVGRAVDAVSDIDTFAVILGSESDADRQWADQQARSVTGRWPFVVAVEMGSYPLEGIDADGRVAAMIKTQSACMHGLDLAQEVGDFSPGVDLLFHSWDLPRDMSIARRLLALERTQAQTRTLCVWIMKRMVRCSFELVMARVGYYTRDLVACHSSFAKYYPSHAPQLAEAVDLARSGGGDKSRCLSVIDALGEWLYNEICVEYGAARIAQLLEKGQVSGHRAGLAPRNRPLATGLPDTKNV